MACRICLVVSRSPGFIFCWSAVGSAALRSRWLIFVLSAGVVVWVLSWAPARAPPLKSRVAKSAALTVFCEKKFIFESSRDLLLRFVLLRFVARRTSARAGRCVAFRLSLCLLEKTRGLLSPAHFLFPTRNGAEPGHQCS